MWEDAQADFEAEMARDAERNPSPSPRKWLEMSYEERCREDGFPGCEW